MFLPGETLLLKLQHVLIRTPSTEGGNYWPPASSGKTVIVPIPHHLFIQPRAELQGTLLVTNLRILLLAYRSKLCLGFPLQHVRAVEKGDEASNVARMTLSFRLHTPHLITLSTSSPATYQLFEVVRKLIVAPTITTTSGLVTQATTRFRSSHPTLTFAYDELFLQQPRMLYWIDDPYRSFIYSAPHSSLTERLELAETLNVTDLEDYPNLGHSIFDPIREYRRLGVKIDLPTPEKLSCMIFGAKIHPGLLGYLLNNRPIRSQNYLNDATVLLRQYHYVLPPTRFNEDMKEFYAAFRASSYYDPFMLFDCPEQFYMMLQYHPQSKLAGFGAQGYYQDTASDGVYDEVDAEDIDQTPSYSQTKTKKADSNFVPCDFRFQDPATGTLLYAHGGFFEPTFFRCLPHMRHYIRAFLATVTSPYVDAVHEPPRDQGFAPLDAWRITWVNTDYRSSPSYPAILAVPTAASDAVVVGSMKFRCKGRCCALSWRSPVTGASLCRCSQPGAGFGLTRNSNDESLLKFVCNAPPSNSVNDLLFVFDARPFISAFANRFKGKGFESSRAYPFSKTVYLNIQNIHAVRESYDAMRKIAIELLLTKELAYRGDLPIPDEQGNDMYASKLLALQRNLVDVFRSGGDLYKAAHNSKWYEHIQTILAGSIVICEALVKLRCNAMIHCSDGWDRTSQLSSLSMLLLDPYYRTLKGFCILIEKEWCSFGHMFATRCRQVGSTKAHPRKEDKKPRIPFLTQKPSTPIFGLQQPTYYVPTPERMMYPTQPQGAYQGLQRIASVSTQLIGSPVDPTTGTDDNFLRVFEDPSIQFNPDGVPQSPLEYSNSQTSPIFLQWLECVYQVMIQFPYEFEFTDQFLLYIAHNVYSGWHGTFIFDNERDRVGHLVQTLTTSAWDAVLKQPDAYINPGYRPTDPLHIAKQKTGLTYLHISCCMRALTPWIAYWTQNAVHCDQTSDVIG
ncbi:Myotubularin-like protein [Giardia muris]|uniref:Myotubularin-like protein n=1 Tax=Giardia muris TaxID=5742 RepID=A0A4Z1TBC2_GIAMU|nr:Myotubularin-like protein [Giardia muris]|eukprot:TNJ30547.1 Myotubularin-like protein [Giardia muris]